MPTNTWKLLLKVNTFHVDRLDRYTPRDRYSDANRYMDPQEIPWDVLRGENKTWWDPTPPLQHLYLGRSQIRHPFHEEYPYVDNRAAPKTLTPLSRFINLESLAIENYLLNKTHPLDLSKLPKLQTLVIAGGFSGPLQFHPLALPGLKSIYLAHTGFNFTLSAQPSLARVHLVSNALVILKGNFSLCKDLEYFAAGWNKPLPDQPLYFSHLDHLTKLTYLYLGGSKIKSWMPLPTSLMRVDLKSSGMTGTLPDLTNFTKLQRLILSGNGFRGPVPSSFMKLTNLIELDLSDNKDLEGKLPPLPLTLQALDLSGNKFNGTIPITYSTLKQLVDLSNNRLTGGLISFQAAKWDVTGNALDIVRRIPTQLLDGDSAADWLDGQPQAIDTDEKIVFPQDIDECLSGHQCKKHSRCTDGFSPRFSYTCACDSGYAPNASAPLPNPECLPVCGDGRLVEDEICDYTARETPVGCSERCLPLPGYGCKNKVCTAICGDGLSVPPETCDEGAIGPWTAGCKECRVQQGWECAQQGQPCKDINECHTSAGLPPLHNCLRPRACINTPGSYFCCAAGLEVDPLESKCIDINECLTGEWNTKISRNTKKPCPSKRSCMNTFGGFECCDAGYQGTDNETCIDYNECIEEPAITTLKCGNIDLCVNSIGTFTCCPGLNFNPNLTALDATCTPCFGDWIDQVDTSKFNYYPSLRNFTARFGPFRYQTCFSSCTQGTRVALRVQKSLACADTSSRTSPCSFACVNQTFLNTASTAIASLMLQFQQADFLDDVISKIYGVRVIWSNTTKRNAQALDFQLSPCPDLPTQKEIEKTIFALAKDLVPNAPGLAFDPRPFNSSSCRYTLTASDPASFLIWGLILGGAIGLLALAAIAAYFYFKPKITVDISALPSSIAWSFQNYLTDPASWDFRGTKSNRYFFCELEPTSKDFHKVTQLLKLLKADDYGVQKITAICNLVLLQNFIGAKKILDKRLEDSPGLFAAQHWRAMKVGQEQNVQKREIVYSRFQQRMEDFSLYWMPKSRKTASVEDTAHPGVAIIAALHGTDGPTADKIAETGFAALSLTDGGYFGKGIYFTTYAMYCLPYLVARSKPVFVISYIIPGNAYPVIEHQESAESLLGTALQVGYNSHYVSTNQAGEPAGPESSQIFDEFVIPQESQVVPAFIVNLAPPGVKKMHKSWNKGASIEKRKGSISECSMQSLEEESKGFLEKTLYF